MLSTALMLDVFGWCPSGRKALFFWRKKSEGITLFFCACEQPDWTDRWQWAYSVSGSESEPEPRRGVTICKDFAKASHWSGADNNLDVLIPICESLTSICLQLFLSQASAVCPLLLYAPTTFFLWKYYICLVANLQILNLPIFITKMVLEEANHHYGLVL